MKQIFTPIKSGFTDLVNRIQLFFGGSFPIDKCVDYSVKKYMKTYKLLEKYDPKNKQSASSLSNAGRLQPYIRRIQEKN